MLMYTPGSGPGMPPLNCNICGARVPGERCERHPHEPGFVPLRDKTVPMFIIRQPKEQP